MQKKKTISDGCTLFPDGDWIECCITHDHAYAKGGTKEQRKKADIVLRNCVAGKGHSVVAWIMYLGVRVGGSPLIKTSYTWDFLSDKPGYKKG